MVVFPPKASKSIIRNSIPFGGRITMGQRTGHTYISELGNCECRTHAHTQERVYSTQRLCALCKFASKFRKLKNVSEESREVLQRPGTLFPEEPFVLYQILFTLSFCVIATNLGV